MNKQFKIWPVLRDVIIVTVLSSLGGFIVGFSSTSGHNSPLYIYSLALSNSLFCIIGFAISGCLAVENRWRHLAIVAIIVWVVSIFNVVFFEFTIVKWAASAIAVAIFALIGGGISLLFKRKTPLEISSNAEDEKFYDEVAREFQEKTLVAGLWTKAYAEMGGDAAKARALYIKYRAAQLAETSRQRRDKQRSEEQTEPSKPLEPAKQIANAPTKSKTGIILAVLAGVIIVIVILANSGSDSTSTASSSSTVSANPSGGGSPNYTPPPAYVPPVCKALDEKNGFKDFNFGMTPEESRKIIPPTDTATNPGPNNTIFIYANTPANRIGDFSFDVLRLCFYEDRLYRIELYFDKFQNEILEAFKANFGEPFDTDSWKMGGQPVQGKAWQGNKVYAVFLSSPSNPSSSAIIYDIAANEKASDYAAKEPERAAKDFGTNRFKTLVMGMRIQDVSLDFTVVDDNQITGVKKVVFTKSDYWNYWQNIGYYPLTSVSAEFFHDELYRIDMAFSQNQNEIFETFKQRFGPLQDNDTWTRDSMKLKAKSAGDGKLSATILAPEVTDGGADGWDSIVLLDMALSREAEQFKDDAPKRAAKDF